MLLASLLKDSARFMVFSHLQERTQPSRRQKPGFRKDLVGISALVDCHATLGLLNARRPRADGGGSVLSPDDKRILQRIISGSIRSPDRLHAAGLVATDCCKHCQARGTTEHLFWDCSHYARVRDVFLRQIQDYIAQVRRHSKKRAAAIEEILRVPAFRHCGICNLNPRIYDHANKLSEEVDPIFEDCRRLNVSSYVHDVAVRDDIYTDGSATGTELRITARAGWGLFSSTDPPLTTYGRLFGPIQTSSRAELRAIVEALYRAGRPACIYSDCKYVVDACHALARDGLVSEDWPDQDLWALVSEFLRLRPHDAFIFKWVPSHMNDDADKRRKFQPLIDQGVITERDVHGNQQADLLAGQGSDMRRLSAEHAWTLHDNRTVAKLVQSMQLQIWKQFQGDDDAPHPLDDEDFELFALAEAADNHQYDDDEDVFGRIDVFGQEDAFTSPAIFPAISEDSLGTFPDRVDPELHSDFRCVLKRPIDFTEIVTATASIAVDADHTMRRRCRAPFEIWAPLIAWLESLSWTSYAGASVSSRLLCTCSWAELLIAFVFMTGFRFDQDLSAAMNLFSVAMRRLFKFIQWRPSYGVGIRNFQQCMAARSAVGFYLPGVNRRPILPAELWAQILSQMRAARTRDDVTRSNFGVGHYLTLSDRQWVSIFRDPLLHIDAGIAGMVVPIVEAPIRCRRQRQDALNRSGPCAFGCTSTSGTSNGADSWHVVPNAWYDLVGTDAFEQLDDNDIVRCIDDSSTLCTKHYRQASRRIAALCAVIASDAPT